MRVCLCPCVCMRECVCVCMFMDLCIYIYDLFELCEKVCILWWPLEISIFAEILNTKCLIKWCDVCTLWQIFIFNLTPSKLSEFSNFSLFIDLLHVEMFPFQAWFLMSSVGLCTSFSPQATESMICVCVCGGGGGGGNSSIPSLFTRCTLMAVWMIASPCFEIGDWFPPLFWWLISPLLHCSQRMQTPPSPLPPTMHCCNSHVQMQTLPPAPPPSPQEKKKVAWCFTPSQSVQLYKSQNEKKRNNFCLSLSLFCSHVWGMSPPPHVSVSPALFFLSVSFFLCLSVCVGLISSRTWVLCTLICCICHFCVCGGGGGVQFFIFYFLTLILNTWMLIFLRWKQLVLMEYAFCDCVSVKSCICVSGAFFVGVGLKGSGLMRWCWWNWTVNIYQYAVY